MIYSESPLCFYCTEYAEVAQDYPVNVATKDVTSFTPRCYLHWKYKCNKCGGMIHFNGISWCPTCKEFTCLNCVDEKMVRKEFLVYDYYYSIPCHKCEKHNPALDFAEYEGTHPFQAGDLRPEENIAVWLPNYNVIQNQEYPHKAWGLERILALGKIERHRRLESLDEFNIKSTWDVNAPIYIKIIRGELFPHEYHHEYRIRPEVYRLLDVQKKDKILDVACGEGSVARYLGKKGAKVTGIDFSKLIDFAIEREKKEKLGINYQKLNAKEIKIKFDEASFDKVVCNMALMDMPDFKSVISQISYVLKENGIFVFSILHPAFSVPTCISFRTPKDSQRNEDKIKVLIDYFDERPAIYYRDIFDAPLFQFHRPISSYINELIKNNLILIEMSEPKASEELVKKFPRNAYLDDDIRTDFLIVKTVKKSNY
jgi:2-polyprenyl-3-methyl-5-hydroxy-6-metoxy-1,4-benzoquinol methylase